MSLYIFAFLSYVGYTCSALQFNATLAEEIYHYAQPSYCQAEKLMQWICEPCSYHPNVELQVFHNKSHNAQAYCGYDWDNNRIIVAIRGTVDFLNWMADFKFPLIQYACKDCKVHQGFREIWNDLSNNVLGCVYELKSNHPSAEIIVTGHSLGAAQSVFAALEINEKIAKVDHFYNFGSPRVGNAEFVKYVEEKLNHTYLARIVHWLI